MSTNAMIDSLSGCFTPMLRTSPTAAKRLGALEAGEHVHRVHADFRYGVAALEHEQRRQPALADHPSVGREIRRLQPEEADRIAGKGIDAQGDHQRVGGEAANALEPRRER